jgi:uncharacterized protein YjeT (DUF2065 family)
MRDFATAIALILVIEGILYALLPEAMKRLAVRATAAPAQSLRIAGWSPPASGSFWYGPCGTKKSGLLRASPVS